MTIHNNIVLLVKFIEKLKLRINRVLYHNTYYKILQMKRKVCNFFKNKTPIL